VLRLARISVDLMLIAPNITTSTGTTRLFERAPSNTPTRIADHIETLLDSA